ncbi:dynamin, partial [Microcoleus sp. HI-ES]|nr:dynamin [Microcoleus sp. HI-ES]MCZ0904172.1 dynamin [Microcoleus sp. HI-ES]
MNLKVETSNFLNDLERVAAVRREIATRLSNIATAINQSELAGGEASGKLGLETDNADIDVASKNLRQGVFRLLVLG